MTEPLLAVRGLDKSFGGLKVLNSVSFNVARGNIKALMGPNGAGKTTLFDIISGLEKPDYGKIRFKGREISILPPERIARLGISRTFQNNQVFGRLSVIENIMIGRYLKTDVSFLNACLWFPGSYREEHRNMTKAFETLEFLGLYDRADRMISQVSYMDRKLIELGRAMAMEPELLLVDEPFGGLSAKEGNLVAKKVIALKEKGISVAIIDHHFGPVSDISDEIAVLHHGEIIMSGKAEEIKGNKTVVSAYFYDGSPRYR